MAGPGSIKRVLAGLVVAGSMIFPVVAWPSSHGDAAGDDAGDGAGDGGCCDLKEKHLLGLPSPTTWNWGSYQLGPVDDKLKHRPRVKYAQPIGLSKLDTWRSFKWGAEIFYRPDLANRRRVMFLYDLSAMRPNELKQLFMAIASTKFNSGPLTGFAVDYGPDPAGRLSGVEYVGVPVKWNRGFWGPIAAYWKRGDGEATKQQFQEIIATIMTASFKGAKDKYTTDDKKLVAWQTFLSVNDSLKNGRLLGRDKRYYLMVAEDIGNLLGVYIPNLAAAERALTTADAWPAWD